MKRLLFVLSAFCLVLAAFLSPRLTGKSHADPAKEVDFPHLDQSQYVGSRKCAECHQTTYADWKDTAHNKMIRPAIANGPNKTILADFSKPDPFRPFELTDVKWVIGHRWKQRFIGIVDGQEVVFPAQWSIKERKWQPYTAKSD